MKHDIHGWLVCDKPAGVTSRQLVGRARRLTGASRLGHGGTLDPLATGILPVALGEATKTIAWCQDALKTYQVTARWGVSTSTDDAEGNVTGTSEVRPSTEGIEAILASFTGDVSQTPPAFSAIKVAGKRAYALARKDIMPDLQPRLVRIERITLVAREDADHASFEVVCGKGDLHARAHPRSGGKPWHPGPCPCPAPHPGGTVFAVHGDFCGFLAGTW